MYIDYLLDVEDMTDEAYAVALVEAAIDLLEDNPQGRVLLRQALPVIKSNPYE